MELADGALVQRAGISLATDLAISPSSRWAVPRNPIAQSVEVVMAMNWRGGGRWSRTLEQDV